jgi:hypothetical protein
VCIYRTDDPRCRALFLGPGPRNGCRPLWDTRCAELLKSLAGRHTNAELADLIAAQTRMRFKVKTISDRRAALGLEAPHINGWSLL